MFFNCFAAKEDAVLLAYAERAAQAIARFFATGPRRMARPAARHQRRTGAAQPGDRARLPVPPADDRGHRPDQHLFPGRALALLTGVLTSPLSRWSALDGARPPPAILDETAAGPPDPR
ncbi:hypothetical protein SAMN05421854_103258 [Amycolatopsis rubida]|uniref:Uncharacterized protein n=1 Tax=Amycolatopsis rubida TaxID=112413 RepID=A0A1I5KML3_9PSEU|nr:hypothetical protein SAMN05421854_103258 [Amycolatopsis rubida]